MHHTLTLNDVLFAIGFTIWIIGFFVSCVWIGAKLAEWSTRPKE